ncbi:MAG: ATP-binding protein [Lentisphaeria bacterium]|nr:ATP-binding protein [Lentisphaeria bacterium]
MSLLESITRGKENKPPRIFLYGQEGVGKSCTAAQAPNPVFIQTEDGLDEINTSKFPLAKSLNDVLNALAALRDEQHDFRTVVLDSADWLERLIWDKVCQDFGVRSIEKADGGYGKGYVHALTYWRQIVSLFNDLRNVRGMIVIVIAHSKVERFEDPENAAYDRYTPRLHKSATSLLCEWVDAVLFATKRFRVSKEEGTGFQGDRAIATAIGANGGERILRTVGSPACIAKNRFNLPAEIPLSWQAFMDAYASGGEANV